MGDEYLITDALVEAVSALELVAEELPRAERDPYRWKWVIIALHGGMQGMMVAALQGSNGLHTLRQDDARRWLDAHEAGGPYPDDLKLDDFLSLYKKVKSDLMIMYVHSQKFAPRGSQGASVKLLNRLRNEFIHFTPRIWVLELAGLPGVVADCLKVAEFLAWDSHNVTWKDQDLAERLKRAFATAKEALPIPTGKTKRRTNVWSGRG